MVMRSVLFGAVVLAVGCGDSLAEYEAGSAASHATAEEPLLRYTQDTSRWKYQGLLPELDDARIVVSLKGHTARVTGLLPSGFTGTIPFYAIREAEGSRTRITVVYPIATGNTALFNDEGLRVRNPEPFDYTICSGTNFAPTDKASFGGFPFIEYVCGHRDRDGRWRSGIAFHGPITTARYEGTTYWSLIRGPVSHACNRMLGEHVLELARLTGFERGVMKTPVKVIDGFDTFRGQWVDVDYPASGFSRPPSDKAFLFRTWQAVRQTGPNAVTLEFPRWACEVSRCPSMPPNRLDPVTGRPL
jgi:hypothetical protein